MNVITATYNSTYPDEQEISLVKSAGELFAELLPKTALPEKKEHVRNGLVDILYELSVSQQNETTKENRKRYHEWVRKNYPDVCRKKGFSKDRYLSHAPQFKEARLPKEQKYIKPRRLLNEKELAEAKKAFAIRLAHVKTEDLPHMIGTAKDIGHRYDKAPWNEKDKWIVGRYINGSIKWRPVDN